MATVKVGRATLDADCVYLEKVQESTDGSRRMSGMIAGTSLEVSNVARTNLRALREGQVIPITQAGDPLLDGYYLIREVEVGYGAGGVAGTGAIPWALRADYLGNASNIFFQSRLAGVNRDAAAVRFHATPSTTPVYTPEPSGGIITRTQSDASALYVALGVTLTDKPRWETTPAAFYRGAAYVKWANTAAGTKYTREGLWLPPGVPSDFEIGNGNLRLLKNAAVNYGFLLGAWNGSSWTGWDLSATYAGSAETKQAITADDRYTLLVNTPELVVVRWERTRAVGSGGRFHLTVSLRRGARFAHIRWGRTSNSQYGIYTSAADPATAGTGYIYDTTAGTNAWLMGSKNTVTNDLGVGPTTSGIYLTASAAYIDAFIGTRNGTGTGENFDDIRNQWYGELTENSWPRARSAS